MYKHKRVFILLLFNFEWPSEVIHGVKKELYLILNGGVAQLGEHLPCKQGVMGSIPIISTSREADTRGDKMERYTEN